LFLHQNSIFSIPFLRSFLPVLASPNAAPTIWQLGKNNLST
jgi:hypothetical protein